LDDEDIDFERCREMNKVETAAPPFKSTAAKVLRPTPCIELATEPPT